MLTSEIKLRIEACGLPCTYKMFPVGAAPPLPFVVWYVDSERNFAADNTNYFNIKHLTVELYTEFKEPRYESAVEAVLRDLGVWTKTEEYIESERCYQITYYMEV